MIRADWHLHILGIAALTALPLLCSSAVCAKAEEARRLSGAEIKRLIVGKAVTDEVHYTDHFHLGGVYEGVFMNKRSTGTWRVKGAQLCVTRGSEEESCDELWRSGSRLERRKPGLSRIRDTVVILPE
jgi:hypothetical protein